MDPVALTKLFGSQPNTSELAERIQRLETQIAQARAEINEMRQAASQPPISLAQRARARLGGLARAAAAVRYRDGTFMSGETVAELVGRRAYMLYERQARGGRERARKALRDHQGRFVCEGDGET